MAIRRVTQEDMFPENEEEIRLAINNGDKIALEEVLAQWKFKDEESLLKFAIAIFKKASGNAIYIDDKGKQIKLTPADSLLKDANEEGDISA